MQSPRVGVSPGTTTMVLHGPQAALPMGLAQLLGERGPSRGASPLVIGQTLEAQGLGRNWLDPGMRPMTPCPPDPVVVFLTDPFKPDSTTPDRFRSQPRGGGTATSCFPCFPQQQIPGTQVPGTRPWDVKPPGDPKGPGGRPQGSTPTTSNWSTSNQVPVTNQSPIAGTRFIPIAAPPMLQAQSSFEVGSQPPHVVGGLRGVSPFGVKWSTVGIILGVAAAGGVGLAFALKKSKGSLSGAAIPKLQRHEGSWMVTSPTGDVRELFNRANVQKAADKGWTVETAGKYLARINADIRKADRA